MQGAAGPGCAVMMSALRNRRLGFVRFGARRGCRRLVQGGAGDGRFGQQVGHEALGFVRSAAIGVRAARCRSGRLRAHRRRRGKLGDGQLRREIGARRLLEHVRRLGLERLQRLERAPELGHGGAAVAQERLEAAGAVAIADQGHADAGVLPAPLLEQLDLHAIGPRQTPGGDRDPARQHELQRAFRRQLIQQRRLERLELDGILVRQHDVVQGAHAVPERILRRPAPCLLRSSARATSRRSCGWLRRGHCCTGTAAPARRHHWTWRDSLAGVGLAGGWWRGARTGAEENASLTDHRNIVHLCCRAPPSPPLITPARPRCASPTPGSRRRGLGQHPCRLHHDRREMRGPDAGFALSIEAASDSSHRSKLGNLGNRAARPQAPP